MKKSMRGVARAIIEQAEGKSSEEMKTLMKEAVAYLASRGMLTRWRDLERDIHEAWREKYGASRITIASAHPLTKEARAKIEQLAKGADLQEVVDPRLMGGAIIRQDERRIDGTVLGALTRLKQKLLA